MNVEKPEVIHEPAHMNHAGAFWCDEYWYFFNESGIRQVFDFENDALEAAGYSV